MIKLSSVLVGVILMSFMVSTWAYHPCKPIARACAKAGYYQGGNKVGKGLFENCVMPVAMGNKTLHNASFSHKTLKNCKSKIISEMKQHHKTY
jgi:hypothetical protein